MQNIFVIAFSKNNNSKMEQEAVKGNQQQQH